MRSIAKETKRKLTAREALIVAKKLEAAKASRQSLAGRKIGKHVVKPGELDVQLTDELSESLRALQVGAVVTFVNGVLIALVLARRQPVQRPVSQHATACFGRTAGKSAVSIRVPHATELALNSL